MTCASIDTTARGQLKRDIELRHCLRAGVQPKETTPRPAEGIPKSGRTLVDSELSATYDGTALHPIIQNNSYQ